MSKWLHQRRNRSIYSSAGWRSFASDENGSSIRCWQPRLQPRASTSWRRLIARTSKFSASLAVSPPTEATLIATGAIRNMPELSYDLIVGLETHVQLLTETKLFCGCS